MKQMQHDQNSNQDETKTDTDSSLLLVDDDRPFLQRLARAMQARGMQVTTAETVKEACHSIETNHYDFAVIDLKLGDGNGMEVIEKLQKHAADSPLDTRIVVLTGYGNIASAVNAVKLGAIDYLAKPADADDIYAALTRQAGEKPLMPESPMSADRVRWEHIQRVYEMCGRNVSETARQLNMHRRTLQRILAKRAPK